MVNESYPETMRLLQINLFKNLVLTKWIQGYIILNK